MTSTTSAGTTAASTDSDSLFERLGAVWLELEDHLDKVPILNRLEAGTVTLEDYQRLLFNLRQQVIDGSPWIARAASNFDIEHFELRAAAIKHAEEEHRDHFMLERDYVAIGGSLEELRAGRKNVGSEALSGYLFNYASRPNPAGLLGAMFIIEGLGERLAGPWSAAISEQLGLGDEAVSFLAYHGANDGDHLDMFDHALALAVTDARVGDEIVRHARIVARLYRLQLEEIDNV